MRGGSDTFEIIIVPKAELGLFDEMMGDLHYLGSAKPTGDFLRQAVVCDGEWVGARRTSETRRPEPSLSAAPRPRYATESCIKGARVKSFYIITTLLDPQLYPSQEIAELYYRRWSVELFFRDLKTNRVRGSVSGSDIGCHFGKEKIRSEREYINKI